MNMLFIKHFFVGFMVSEIPRVSVFGNCPYSVTFPYITCIIISGDSIEKILIFIWSPLEEITI